MATIDGTADLGGELVDPINVFVVVAIALAVIFGSKKIPEMARSIGRAQGEFKKGLREGAIPDEPAPTEGSK